LARDARLNHLLTRRKKTVLLFVFWYCHKRGKETRLEKEKLAAQDAQDAQDAQSDLESVSDMSDSIMVNDTDSARIAAKAAPTDIQSTSQVA
jgi:hypothetical protein